MTLSPSIEWSWEMGQRIRFTANGRPAYYFISGAAGPRSKVVVRWLEGDGGPELDDAELTQLRAHYMHGPHGAGWRDGRAQRPKKSKR